MPHKTPVAEVMTRRVRTAEPHQALRELWPILVEEVCHHLPILEEGRPVGMISVTDLVRIARKHGVRSLSDLPSQETAGDVMSRDLQTLYLDDPVEVAIDRIGRGDIHALVVLDEGDRLAGIVTHHDLLRYLTS
jgi:CBS-domain-containing membrane protein